jgi:Flp pilus assembly protein TadG
MTITRKRPLKCRSAGVAVVEFALVLPLLLIILFGIVDFGFMLYDKAVITNAVREGARAGIVLRNPRLTKAEIESVVVGYCDNNLIRLAGTGSTCTALATLPATITFSAPLQVNASYRYDGPIFSLLAAFFPKGVKGPLDIGAQSVMRYE